MDDESVTTGDENKRKTVCNDSDDDESEDKWFVPNGKTPECEKSDEGGTVEARGQEGMQSSDKWSRLPSEEGCDNGCTESVAEYAKPDEKGTDEASGRDDMLSSSDQWSPHSVEDSAIDNNQSVVLSRVSDSESMMEDESVTTGDANKTKTECDDSDDDESGDKWLAPNDKLAEYAKSDEGGTGEARGQEDMQSSDKWSRLPSEESCDIGSTKSVTEYAKSDEGGTDEASCRDDMQSSSDECSTPSVEDNPIGNIQLDDVHNTREQNRQCIEHIRTELLDKLTRLGPQNAADYIKQQLYRWETEEVRFAVAGQSATGKSTFINTFRGINEGQDGFADVGFGDETEEISEYKHPVNKNIIFCDLPGLSLKFTKLKFLEMVNLSDYSYILIFFESVLSEGDEWLTGQIQEKHIPFCLVRSKVDRDVESRKGKQIGEKGTLLKIRQKIKDSMSTNTAFTKAELFLISSEKPHIGEMSNLQDHMKEKLPSSKFSAVIFSLPILTEMVIEKKLQELIDRMPYILTGARLITLVPIPYMYIPINVAFIKREVRHYVKVFGLDQTHNENIEGLKNDFSVVSVDSFTEKKIIANYKLLFGESLLGGNEGILYLGRALIDLLFELQEDAITVYKHILNKDLR